MSVSSEVDKPMANEVSGPPEEVLVGEIEAATFKRILRKTDLVIMPLIVIGMTLAFLDKNGLAYAAVYGLKTDTNLQGQEYSWLGSIFYFGYLMMEFPNLWIITQFPIGRYMGFCLVCWGICLACMAACTNFGGLATIRFLLGVFEAALLPCLLQVNSTWYRREEQPLRTAFWYNTFAGIFGGILSYAIGHINGSLSTWRYIFIIYGAVTIAAGVLIAFALPESPATAWFLTPEERKVAILRVASNQTGIEAHKAINKGQILEALKDPKYWIVALFVIAQSITNAGITNFNPLIISGYGFSTSKTVLMATPQAAVAMVGGTIFTFTTLYVPNLRCILWVLSSCIALAGAVMVYTLDPTTQRDASLAGVYLMGFYNVPWVLMLSLLSSNTAGMTKKGFNSISVAVFYAVGNIIGPQFFRTSQAPHYSLGIAAMLGAFSVMAATGILYYLVCLLENKRRDRKYGRVDVDFNALSAGLRVESEDLTDLQNRDFRYTY